MNEQELFLKDTETDLTKVDVLDAPLFPEKSSDKEGDDMGEVEDVNGEDAGEKGEVKPRNRRERRLTAALQAERESSSFLAGKLAARSEAEIALTEEKDYLKSIERIYGTDSPEAQLATDLLKKAIIGARDDAKQQAIEELRAERNRELEETVEAETELESMIEEIEDEYGVKLNSAQERSFFTLLERMSPKDREGNVIEYADPHAVYEVFQDKLRRSNAPDNRAKDMSSRSMTQSGAQRDSNVDTDATARFLQEQGII